MSHCEGAVRRSAFAKAGCKAKRRGRAAADTWAAGLDLSSAAAHGEGRRPWRPIVRSPAHSLPQPSVALGGDLRQPGAPSG